MLLGRSYLWVFLLSSALANAVQDIGTIKNVFIFETSYGFRLNGGFQNAASEFGCSSAGGFARIPAVSSGNTNSKEMYSAILAAHAAGFSVRINTSGCMGSHFKVSGIYVDK